MRILAFSILLCGLVLAGCGGRADDSAVVLADVGDTTITAADFKEDYYGMAVAERPVLDSLGAKRDFLEDLVNKVVMEIAAYEALPELTVQQGWRMERFRRTRLTQVFRERLVREKVEATEADIDKAYEHMGREVFLEGILLPEEDMAHQMMDRIQEGATFEAICREYSIYESANPDRCGEIGWSSAGQLTNFDMQVAAWEAEPGDIVGPYGEMRGWWILRVGESRPVEVEQSREELYPRLKEMVLRPRHLARDKAVQDSLLDLAGVEYPQEGQLLMLEKFEWTPPPDQQGDPMARYNASRVIPTVTEEEAEVPVVVFKDGTVWDAEEFLERASWYPSGLWPLGNSKEELEEFYHQLVRDDAYIRAAESLNMEQDPLFKDVYEQRLNKLRVNYLYHEIVVGPVKPSQEEITAWYRDNRERYRTPPSYRVALFASADEALMQELRESWIAGASFAELRDAYESRTDDLVYVGDSSWLHEGDDPAIDSHLAEVKVGDVAPLFRRNDQVFAIRVLDRRDPRIVTYEEAKETIDKDATTFYRDKALKDFLADYKERIGVTIHDQALQALEVDPQGEAPPQDAVR